MSVDAILSRLAGLKQVGGAAWMGRCPAHEDRSASLSVRETGEGRTLVKCFAGCKTVDVLAALELDWAELFPPDPSPQGNRPWRARHSALDLLAIIDADVTEASIILGDIRSRGRGTPEELKRLRECAGRIGRVRDSARRLWE